MLKRTSFQMLAKSPGPLVTLGYLYYCDEAALRSHLSKWSEWPAPVLQLAFFLVVDDGSPSAHEALQALTASARARLPLAILRIHQDLAWNIGGARNLLFTMAPTEFVLMLDMDVVVPVSMATQLHTLVQSALQLEVELNRLVIFTHFGRAVDKAAKPYHPAVMLLRRSTYWKAGGCDEDFVGAHGGTDPHFKWRAMRTRNVSVIPISSDRRFKWLSLLGMRTGKGHRLICNTSPDNISPDRNKALYRAKINGSVAWSNEYLRFTWEWAYGARKERLVGAPHSGTPAPPAPRAGRWSPEAIVSFMGAHPQRAYFSRLFRDGGFRTGMEVGVAGGRFSEHFLIDNANIGPWAWHMVEPFPNKNLIERMGSGAGSWSARRVGGNARRTFIKALSSDRDALSLPEASFDFIYLDGDHNHEGVKREMFDYWPKVAPGGVLAGHDYCYHGEQGLPLRCRGCARVPMCGQYTEKSATGDAKRAKSQAGVVRAVQEWLAEAQPQLELHHTAENFTIDGLGADGMSFDLVLTKTRNPSWFVVKPTVARGTGHSLNLK